MKNVIFAIALFAVIAGASVAHAEETPRRHRGDRAVCVQVSHADYPSGWYCPSEQARQNQIELLKSWISALQAQLASLVNA